MSTGSPEASCAVAVLLVLGPHGLGVVLLLLGDARELLGHVRLHT